MSIESLSRIEGMTDRVPLSNAGVRIPPPFLFVIGFLAGGHSIGIGTRFRYPVSPVHHSNLSAGARWRSASSSLGGEW
jgi:hypothetical protein